MTFKVKIYNIVLHVFQMYGVFSFGALLYTCVIYSANIKVSQYVLSDFWFDCILEFILDLYIQQLEINYCYMIYIFPHLQLMFHWYYWTWLTFAVFALTIASFYATMWVYTSIPW